MAFIEKPIWSEDGNTLTNVLVNDILVTYNRTDLWYDGTPLDDSKLDSDLVYVKYEGKYLVRNFEYGQVLQKDTMQDMRDLSSYEILLLKMGVYKHVQLNGYYQKGDTPVPIEYHLSDTEEEEDGGSVFSVKSIKLEHEFVGEVDIRYFGARIIEESNNYDNSSIIQKCNNFCRMNMLKMVGFGQYYISSEVILNCNLDMRDSTLLTDTESIAVSVGKLPKGTRITNTFMYLPKVKNILFSDNFTDITSTGLEIRGGRFNDITINEILGFKIGVNIQSDLDLWTDDLTWNKIKFTSLINNETQWKIEINNTGYINQNTFENFMCSKHSTVDKTIDKQLVAINNTGLRRIDGNTFINCAFESSYVYSEITNVVELQGLSYNTFIGCRYELTGGNKRILLDGGEYNRFIGGYGLRKEIFNFINNPNYSIEGMNWSDYSYLGLTINSGNINLRGQVPIRSYGTVYTKEVYNNGEYANNHVERYYLDTDKRNERQWHFGETPITTERVQPLNTNTTLKVVQWGNIYRFSIPESADFYTGTKKVLKNRTFFENSPPIPTDLSLINGELGYNSTRKRLASTDGDTWFDYDGVPLGTRRRGTTAQRPNISDLYDGFLYIDTTLNINGKPIWVSGENWVDSTGAVV